MLDIEKHANHFISRFKRCTRATYRWRFARFAQYMGLRPRAWPAAIKNLIALPEGQGLDRVRGFRPWLRSRGYPYIASNGCRSGIQGFVEYLRAEGVITWTIRNRSVEKMLAKWSECSPLYQQSVLEWLAMLGKHGLHADTRSRYRTILLHLGLFLKHKHLSLKRLKHRHLVGWLQDLNAKGVAHTTINSFLRTAGRFCEWLIHSGGLEENPFERVGFITVSQKLPKTLEHGEVVRTIHATRTPRDRAILEILYATGCRSSEIRDLNINDIALGRRLITCAGPYATKRALPLNKAATTALRRYLPLRQKRQATTDALFLNQYGIRLGLPGLRTMIANAGRRAGIAKHITPDLIRNTFATQFLNRRGKAVTLKHLLGHKTFAATSRFGRAATGLVQRLYDKLHPRA